MISNYQRFDGRDKDSAANELFVTCCGRKWLILKRVLVAKGPRKADPYEDDDGWMQKIDAYPSLSRVAHMDEQC